MDISSYLSSDHLSKRGDVTEAELIVTRAMSMTQLTRITSCPRHRPLEDSSGKPKSSQVTSLPGNTS